MNSAWDFVHSLLKGCREPAPGRRQLRAAFREVVEIASSGSECALTVPAASGSSGPGKRHRSARYAAAFQYSRRTIRTNLPPLAAPLAPIAGPISCANHTMAGNTRTGHPSTRDHIAGRSRQPARQRARHTVQQLGRLRPSRRKLFNRRCWTLRRRRALASVAPLRSRRRAGECGSRSGAALPRQSPLVRSALHRISAPRLRRSAMLMMIRHPLRYCCRPLPQAAP
jgi:hypothetical protein